MCKNNAPETKKNHIMKPIFLILEREMHTDNDQIIGVFTVKTKAINAVIDCIENINGEISVAEIDFINENLHSKGFDKNYTIVEQDVNEIFNLL